MQNKIFTLAEAARLVSSGQTLALGGMTLYRRPVAFVQEVLRRTDPPHDLTLLAFTAGYESDLLVGAGLIKAVRSCYFGLEIFGFAPMFSAAANAGLIEIIEETEASIASGLRARMAGLSFLPSSAWVGTDLPELRPDIQVLDDPYTRESLTAFPAIPVDIAVIHALEADIQGNVRLNTNLGIDRELAMVADCVIVTAEKIVERITGEVTLEGTVIDCLVEVPRGAWPTSCYPSYPVGGGELLRYVDECAANRFETYLQTVLG